MPVNRPHDRLFRAVFGHAPEAAALLRAHLPETLARDLQWSSLTRQDATFVDDELRGSESDLLFSVERTAGDQPPVWLYVLLEHQSKPSRWMPFRLLKYCCRIWDRSRRTFPQERYLRPIIPVVFYQGRRRWRHAAQFAELFAPPVRTWPWVPRFLHLLIDQSPARPPEVRGALRGRIAQLMMMAAYRRRREALQRAAHLLTDVMLSGDRDAVRPIVRYLWATQGRAAARRFGEELRDAIPEPGGDLMTYAEELIREGEQRGRREGEQRGRREGEQRGRIEGQVRTIERLVRAGVQWPLIESATGIDREALSTLKRRLEGPETNAEPTDDRRSIDTTGE